MKLFESLKRLFEPRARPPVETIGAPTADRPSPPGPEPLPEPAYPDVIAAVDDTSVVSEVQELPEAVAEPPVSAPELEADVPVPTREPTPTLPQALTEEVVDLPSAPPEGVEGALVLTLATPAATFTVARAAATIGRGQDNTIRLDDLSVSRRHARIAYRQGGYWLSDTGSMGGTWVDGTRLNAPYRIGSGQVIDIGLYRLTAGFATGPAGADKKEATRKPRSEIAGQVRRRR